MSELDDSIFGELVSLEGGVAMTWEAASRCSCYTTDTEQPQWDCPLCSGYGAIFAAAQPVTALFRSQARWISPRREGEFEHAEAQCTFPLTVKPTYIDRRVRDRFTVTQAQGDLAAGTVFYPAGEPSPFIFDGVQYAWRVQLQGMEQNQRLVKQ